jgi:hypothetical protein
MLCTSIMIRAVVLLPNDEMDLQLSHTTPDCSRRAQGEEHIPGQSIENCTSSTTPLINCTSASYSTTTETICSAALVAAPNPPPLRAVQELVAALEAAGAAFIAFNPLTPPMIARALGRIAEAEGLAPPPQLLAAISEAAAGDLRSAVVTLQLQCGGLRPEAAQAAAKKVRGRWARWSVGAVHSDSGCLLASVWSRLRQLLPLVPLLLLLLLLRRLRPDTQHLQPATRGLPREQCSTQAVHVAFRRSCVWLLHSGAANLPLSRHLAAL